VNVVRDSAAEVTPQRQTTWKRGSVRSASRRQVLAYRLPHVKLLFQRQLSFKTCYNHCHESDWPNVSTQILVNSESYEKPVTDFLLKLHQLSTRILPRLGSSMWAELGCTVTIKGMKYHCYTRNDVWIQSNTENHHNTTLSRSWGCSKVVFSMSSLHTRQSWPKDWLCHELSVKH
jgi:hypothetical protein